MAEWRIRCEQHGVLGKRRRLTEVREAAVRHLEHCSGPVGYSRVEAAEDLEMRTDGGCERLPWCDNCEAFSVPIDDGSCGECWSAVAFREGSI